MHTKIPFSDIYLLPQLFYHSVDRYCCLTIFVYILIVALYHLYILHIPFHIIEGIETLEVSLDFVSQELVKEDHSSTCAFVFQCSMKVGLGPDTTQFSFHPKIFGEPDLLALHFLIRSCYCMFLLYQKH